MYLVVLSTMFPGQYGSGELAVHHARWARGPSKMAKLPEPLLLAGSSGPWWMTVMPWILVIKSPISHVSCSR
jgi:hypothetical protein